MASRRVRWMRNGVGDALARREKNVDSRKNVRRGNKDEGERAMAISL